MKNSEYIIPGVTLGEVKRKRGQVTTWRAFGVESRVEFDVLKVPDNEIAQMVRADKREVRLGVTVELVRRVRGLKGTWYHFGVDNREDFEAKGLSDEDVADYILANRRAKEQEEYVEVIAGDVSDMRRRGKSTTSRKTGIDLRERWEEKMQEYHESYEITTPNDVAAIRTLAWMDVQIEYWQRTIIELSGSTAKDVRNRLTELNKQVKDTVTESRALQKLLEIDKSSRKQTDESGIDTVADMVKDAAWLLENEVQVVSHKCPDNKVIEIGWEWQFFPTHPPRPASSNGKASGYVRGEVLFKQECPNCGQVVEVVFKERGIALSGKDFDIPELRALVG